MQIKVLICARSGSKGIKNKNIVKLNKKPLIQYTIEAAKKVKEISDIYISTDSKKIKNISEKLGAKVPFLRPKKLSGDKTPEWNVWRHFIKNQKLNNNQVLLVLPVTSPFRDHNDIKKCIRMYKSNRFDIIIGITESKKNPYFNMVEFKNNNLNLVKKIKKISRRQDAPKVYDITTFFFMTSCEYINKNSHIFDGKVGSVVLPNERSVDLDTIQDLKFAKYMLKNS